MTMNDIIDKWNKVGLLDNGKKPNVYKRELLVEKRKYILEGILPLTRRIMARTLASELVAVKPMSLPTGTLFGLDIEPENLYKRILLVEKTKQYKTRRFRRGGWLRGGRQILPPTANVLDTWNRRRGL
jgi:hypothetical protein